MRVPLKKTFVVHWSLLCLIDTLIYNTLFDWIHFFTMRKYIPFLLYEIYHSGERGREMKSEWEMKEKRETKDERKEGLLPSRSRKKMKKSMIMIMAEDAGHDQKLEKKLLFKDLLTVLWKWEKSVSIEREREREKVSSGEKEKRDWRRETEKRESVSRDKSIHDCVLWCYRRMMGWWGSKRCRWENWEEKEIKRQRCFTLRFDLWRLNYILNHTMYIYDI